MRITIDVDCPSWIKRLARVAMPALAIAASGVALAVPPSFMPNTTLTSAALNTAFSDVTVVAFSAQRTGSVGPDSGWTTIPGMSVNFTLTNASLVQVTANGMQRTTPGSASAVCQAAYRFVVDGVPQGDAALGQRLQASNGAVSLQQTWSIGDFHTLAPGDHTSAVQALTNGGTGATGCTICAEYDGSLQGYEGCTLNGVAVPQ